MKYRRLTAFFDGCDKARAELNLRMEQAVAR